MPVAREANLISARGELPHSSAHGTRRRAGPSSRLLPSTAGRFDPTDGTADSPVKMHTEIKDCRAGTRAAL